MKRGASHQFSQVKPLSRKYDFVLFHGFLQAHGRASNPRMHLLTGGQGIEQFVHLRWTDVRADSITTCDAKGRPGQAARRHTRADHQGRA
ncbi:MAG TPA: hypothetical protein VE029_07160 [Rhizobacter sp.]|nr:hypothetical protein [Rhizobacter sp.]